MNRAFLICVPNARFLLNFYGVVYPVYRRVMGAQGPFNSYEVVNQSTANIRKTEDSGRGYISVLVFQAASSVRLIKSGKQL